MSKVDVINILNIDRAKSKSSLRDFDFMLFAFVLNMRFIYDFSVRLLALVGLSSDGFIQSFRVLLYLLLFFMLLYRLIFVHKEVVVPLGIILGLSIIIAFSQLFNSNLRQIFLIQIVLIFSQGISFFLATYYASSDPKALYLSIRKFIPVITIYSFFVLLNPFLNQAGAISGYQALSYYILPYAIICFWEGVKKRSLPNLVLGFFLLYIIIGYGGRGALVSVLISFVFLLYINKKSYKIILLIILVAIFVILLYIYWDQLVLQLEYYLPYSRTVKMLRMNKFSTYDSRTNIILYLEPIIKDSPLRINGFGANHLYVNEYYKRLGIYSPLTATHAHNIFIALLVDWGLLIGGFLCISLIKVFFKTLKATIKTNDEFTKIIFTIIVLTNLIHSMISGSYATGGEIWIALGYLIARSRMRKIKIF